MVSNVVAIAAAVVSDAIRRKVFYLVLLFAALLSLMIPQLPSYGAGVVAGVFREVALALVFVASLTLSLSLAANRVPGEIERRTAYNVLSKRVRRWEYLAGTWLGIFIVVGLAIAAFTVVAQGVGLMRYHDPMWRLWEGSFGVWLEMGALTAFAVAVSAISGPVVVVTASLAFLFVAHVRGSLIPQVAETGQQHVIWANYLYPSFDTFNVINPVAHGDGITLAYAAVMVGVFVAWTALLLLLGTAVFSRRDL